MSPAPPRCRAPARPPEPPLPGLRGRASRRPVKHRQRPCQRAATLCRALKSARSRCPFVCP
eukprot:6174714-Pleurochrysis_carterae.AAC.2